MLLLQLLLHQKRAVERHVFVVAQTIWEGQVHGAPWTEEPQHRLSFGFCLVIVFHGKNICYSLHIIFYVTGNTKHTLHKFEKMIFTLKFQYDIVIEAWCQLKTIVTELIFLVCFTVNSFVSHRLVVKLIPKYLQQESGEGVNKYWKKKLKRGGASQ